MTKEWGYLKNVLLAVLSLFHEPALEKKLCDLHRIGRRTLTDIVRHHEEVAPQKIHGTKPWIFHSKLTD